MSCFNVSSLIADGSVSDEEGRGVLREDFPLRRCPVFVRRDRVQRPAIESPRVPATRPAPPRSPSVAGEDLCHGHHETEADRVGTSRSTSLHK